MTALAATALVAVAGIAIAQQKAASSGKSAKRKLHEDLAAPSEKPSSLIGASTSTTPPTAFTAGDKVVMKPPLDQAGDKASKGEPVLGQQGAFAADRTTEMKPDSNTGPDATLHYVSVFNPDVLPFKRMSALDAVGDDYTLKVGHTALVELPIGGTTNKTRDRFWGSVLVQLRPGVEVALPSVAPDMRILSYEIKPPVALHFEKDGTDNFYVRSDDAAATGTFRLIFLADADAGYFAPQLPPGGALTPKQIAKLAPPSIVPILPPAVRRAAQRTIDKLGLDENYAMTKVFNDLVAYFRAFEAKPFPPSTGDIYRDLCDSQAGVCRHRAFAFMITANALGIPTRFVENEAHAFVEVWFPHRNWQRIDLGGAALRMDVTGAENKTLHRPRADDPFAKPQQYKQNYTQLEGEINGLTAQQISDKRRPLDQAPPSGSYGQGPGTGSSNDRITPDPTLPAVTADPQKGTPRLAITMADTSAYRGDVIHVEGTVFATGKALTDHRVDIFMAPAGHSGKDPVQLGSAVTDATGAFRIDLTVPAELKLEAYELYISSPEDAYYNAALSD